LGASKVPPQEELQRDGSRSTKARGASQWWQKWELEGSLLLLLFYFLHSVHSTWARETMVPTPSTFLLAIPFQPATTRLIVVKSKQEN
jgi:hypothetical protein